MNTYDFRKQLSEQYLSGKGIEIGAGSNPNPCVPGATSYVFDKRTTEEVARYCGVPVGSVLPTHPMEDIPGMFPTGADYLIAHHVIEHLSNPLENVVKWVSYVKQDGYLFISVPHVDHCPDKGRPAVSIEHLFLDYALERGDGSFDSREHAYSFIMSWIDLGMTAGKNKFEVAELAHQQASLEKNDIHWHAFTEDIFRKFVALVSIVSKRRVEILKLVSPENSESLDIMCICKLDSGCWKEPDKYETDVIGTIDRIKTKISRVVELLYNETR